MKNRELLYKYRGNRCAGCGMEVVEMVNRYGTFNRMFEFHHIDEQTKASNYDNLIRRKLSTQQIEEIEKCALLCRECHGILHAQNIQGEIELCIELDNRKVCQKIKGQIIYDTIDQEMKFVTNESIMIHPYRIEVTGQEPKVLCGVEIRDDSYFMKLFQNLEVGHEVEVFNYLKTERNMRAVCIDNQQIRMTLALGFPFFTIKWGDIKNDSPYLWYRNGMVLTKDGEFITKGELNVTMELINS